MSDIKKYFASTEKEALEKYKNYKNVDPFPNIPPALLSSGQIQAYIAETGMVYPYFQSNDSKEEKVTQASLTMTIGPEIIYWDDKENRQYEDSLNKGDEIILLPNSITFLRPAERVNMPDYIAARFNLRIVHVHRGLLLGTGPLLDPGFKGYPMIPVHNLTDNEYRVHVGEEFIGVEFTKIEIGNKGFNETKQGQELPFKYIENRGKTLDYEFPRYIAKNVPQRKVKSSLSGVIDKAKEVVEKQKKVVWGSVICAILTICALIYGGYQLTISATSIINDARKSVNHYKEQEVLLNKLQGTVEKLEKEIGAIGEITNHKLGQKQPPVSGQSQEITNDAGEKIKSAIEMVN